MLLGLLTYVFTSKAVDRIVADGGSGGAFATISDALSAASAGDRILVYPKSGGVAYAEMVNITFPVQILCATEAQRFSLVGDITVGALSGSNASVTLSGINIITGNISTNNHAATTGRCKVNILGCRLESGYINFSYNNWDMNIAADSLLNGYVKFRHGKLIGNFIASSSPSNYNYVVEVTSESTPTSDSVLIMSNILYGSAANAYNAGISWSSTTHYFQIHNNYIYVRNVSGYGGGMYITDSRYSLSGTNSIINNTIYSSTYLWMGIYSYYYGIFNSSNREILNNLVLCSVSSAYNAIYLGGNPTINSISYNFASSATGGLNGSVNDGTNNFSSNAFTGFNVNTGEISLASDAVNAGYPDSTYFDLNLTRNDVGAYGGSYTLAQFHPMNLGNARVTFMRAPRRVLVGQSVNVRAEGFDR